MRRYGVMCKTVTVRDRCEVEPMRSPPLAVMRRSEQTIDKLLISSRRRITDKGVDFLDRWRQTGQPETDAPDELLFAGARRQCEMVCLELSQNEIVDWVLDVVLKNAWRFHRLERLERPMPPVRLADRSSLKARRDKPYCRHQRNQPCAAQPGLFPRSQDCLTVIFSCPQMNISLSSIPKKLNFGNRYLAFVASLFSPVCAHLKLRQR